MSGSHRHRRGANPYGTRRESSGRGVGGSRLPPQFLPPGLAPEAYEAHLSSVRAQLQYMADQARDSDYIHGHGTDREPRREHYRMGSHREERSRVSPRRGDSRTGGRHSSRAEPKYDESDEDDEDDDSEDDRFANEYHSGARRPLGRDSYSSRSATFPRPRDRDDDLIPASRRFRGPSARRDFPVADNDPHLVEIAPRHRFPPAPLGHPDYRGGYGESDDAFVPPRLDRGLNFGAVGSDEDMDDIITRLMAAGPGQGEGPPPASQGAIASLEKKKIDRDMIGADGQASCTVCMEDGTVGEEVTELPCKHWFHEKCITSWLLSHDTCPNCRKSIGSSEGPARPSRSIPRSSTQSVHGERSSRRRAERDESPPQGRQRRPGPRYRDDEAYARRLQQEYCPSVQDDEEFARRLQAESRPSIDDDEELARRLQDEYERAHGMW